MKIKDFISKYGGLQFSKLHYRPGAAFTSEFGLTERYKIINGNMHWGYPGIHNGVDRGYSGVPYKNINNGIFSPFNFYKSGIEDFKGIGYGCRIWLYHELGFVLRIAHCYPNEIMIMPQLERGAPVFEGTFIAPIGSYGNSTGPHTHTEIEAWGKNSWLEKCDGLEFILQEKFGDKSNKNITMEELEILYQKTNKTQLWSFDKILQDYKLLCNQASLSFLNSYKMVKQTSKGASTFYSTKALFSM